MKKFLEAIPFVLLLALVPYFFYNTPNIAQSIIILAITALCGFRYHQIEKEQPDYVQIFQKEIRRIEKESKELKDNYGKITLQDMKAKEPLKFRF